MVEREACFFTTDDKRALQMLNKSSTSPGRKIVHDHAEQLELDQMPSRVTQMLCHVNQLS